MYDIDVILSVIENPTRRRILMALVREPNYPLQLSRELGVSQQAIMKNLDILERSGLVESWKESSDKGPLKIVYRPTSEFTLTIDLRNGMFMTTLLEPESGGADEESFDMCFEEIIDALSGIDIRIGELGRMREEMIKQRNMMIRSFMGGPIAGGLDHLERSILYEMLNSPSHNAEEVSREMDVREDRMAMIVNNIGNKRKES